MVHTKQQILDCVHSIVINHKDSINDNDLVIQAIYTRCNGRIASFFCTNMHDYLNIRVNYVDSIVKECVCVVSSKDNSLVLDSFDIK